MSLQVIGQNVILGHAQPTAQRARPGPEQDPGGAVRHHDPGRPRGGHHQGGAARRGGRHAQVGATLPRRQGQQGELLLPLRE